MSARVPQIWLPVVARRIRGGASLVVRGVSGALLDLIAPPRCLACGQLQEESHARIDWCEACRAELVPPSLRVCLRCATPLAAETVGIPAAQDCPVCRDERWAFESVVARGVYRGVLRQLLLEAKHPQGAAAARGLGRLLAGSVRERWPGELSPLVVPLPMHWRRRLNRRINSAECLAEGLAEGLATRATPVLWRRRATRQQTAVAPSSRAANVRGAFAVRSGAALTGRTVLLVDDVLTTGSSCSAAAQALRGAGAARVVAVVAARRVAPG
ncbi:ComF family protein [Botrimarina hoheduenensis]|uniref:ComF family protein n=1 Tax=Botrimarina hoheduenensis TaxID=2528000 RepID=UPI0018D469B6|nr:double zinc ribbon domain-containing protein [Botrimarina hoheduenensis]